LASFNLARSIKFINQLGGIENFSNIIDKNVQLLKFGESKFFGKAPYFYFQVDPLTKKEVGFDENIYLKTFINNYNISLENFYNRINENIFRAQKTYYSTYFKEKIQMTLSLYFNVLTLLTNENYKNDIDKLKFLYRSFVGSPGLGKFPRLYLNYLENYNKIIFPGNDQENCQIILGNLINIASIRKLTKEEEE
jgi:hypothetical protein